MRYFNAYKRYSEDGPPIFVDKFLYWFKWRVSSIFDDVYSYFGYDVLLNFVELCYIDNQLDNFNVSYFYS